MNVKAAAPPDDQTAEILSDEALAFVGELQERFGARRAELLQARRERGAPRYGIRYPSLLHWNLVAIA